MPLDLAPDERLDDALLDRIIDHQVRVAWLGETPRLGWWRADTTDLEGGGDFFRRWLPGSADIAGIDAARRSAMVVDEALRREAVGTGDQDELLTLFHLGSAVDRQVEDRFRFRRAQRTISVPTGAFERSSSARELAALGAAPPTELVKNGRRIRRRLGPLDGAKVDALVVALVDDGILPDRYPMPHYDRRVAE